MERIRNEDNVMDGMMTENPRGVQPSPQGHPLYARTADCEDPAELVGAVGDGVALVLPDEDHAAVLAALRAKQAELGGAGRCQEKVDGCWCALAFDGSGRIASATSRAGLPLRFARGETPWVGHRFSAALAGWTIVGELEAGTQRAAAVRDGERDLEPLMYAFGAFDPDGVDRTDRLPAVLSHIHHPRLRPVPEALPGEDWADFLRSVLDRGGEGVVVREPGGRCLRYKPVFEADRVALSVLSERDRNGKLRTKVRLGLCTSAGQRPRYRPTQTVIIPRHIMPAELKGKRVVRVRGASVDADGVIRHASIADVRPREEKQPWECRG
ncbi:MAG: hypothetical protein ACOY3Y_21195 [Acidobacteriota bacterium]